MCASLCPVNAFGFIYVPRPATSTDITKFVLVDQLERLLTSKILTAWQRILDRGVTMSRGVFIGTSNGVVFTSSVALKNAKFESAELLIHETYKHISFKQRVLRAEGNKKSNRFVRSNQQLKRSVR